MKLPILLVYLTALIVGLSYGMHNPIVPVFAKEVIGASYVELGVIGLTNFLPYMFIPLFAGIVSDVFGKDAPYLGFFVIGIIVTVILVFNRKKITNSMESKSLI